MNVATLLRLESGLRIRAGLVGAGQFGHGFVAQSARSPHVEVVALAERDVAKARAAFRAAGVDDARVRECATEGEAARALAEGARVVVEEGRLLAALPIDVVVEATGEPETGARNALAAIEGGKHVAIASKETDCVVGPILFERARERGLVYTPVDGDQPSLAIGLVAWARLLGLEVVAAGKATEYDFVYDAARATVVCNRREVAARGLDGLWRIGAADPRPLLDARASLLAGLTRATVPDLAELAIVANATGLRPDVPELHAPIARTLEVPAILRPRPEGVLGAAGALDVFCCLRRTDEASFAGGVFVVVRCEDAVTWGTLREKGMPVTGDGRHALLYNPQHLLGIEALASVISAVGAGAASGGDAPRPVCDVYARAARDLAAGEPLALGERHSLPGVEPVITDARPADGTNPVPYYLAAGATLARAVPKGALIACDAVQRAPDSVLAALRREQDRRFLGAAR